MDLVVFVKEIFQNVAEHAASYRIGQTILRQLDRGLWVVEKCARWAVPPPLDVDDRPQPELVRPLPWVFFLMLLITLRVTRESISIINLFMGKPPLRSADVVMYIQSKRRYLRTLKYQGNRMMRSRTSAGTPRSWHCRLQALLDLTMCFRGSYGNNNTMRHSNNEEVLVVKRSKRDQQPTGPVASTSETTMDRLIEKMMVDLDADSDDSSYTLTNVTSFRSDHSDIVDSDQETIMQNDSNPSKSDISDNSNSNNKNNNAPEKEDSQKGGETSGPEKTNSEAIKKEEINNQESEKEETNNGEIKKEETNNEEVKKEGTNSEDTEKEVKENDVTEKDDKGNDNATSVAESPKQPEDSAERKPSPKEESQNLLDSEKNNETYTPPVNQPKAANGQIANNKRKEPNNERREPESESEKKH